MKRIFKVMLLLCIGLATIACGPEQKMDQPGEERPEIPVKPVEPEAPETPDSGLRDHYVKVSAAKTDWSGDYLIAAESEGKLIVFGKWEKYGRALPGVDLLLLMDEQGRIPASAVEEFKSVFTRNGEIYSIKVPDVGFLGLEKRHNLTRIQETPEALRFHWTLEYVPEDDLVEIRNAETEGRQLLWNNAPDCRWFGGYSSPHDDILPVVLFSRVQAKESETR